MAQVQTFIYHDNTGGSNLRSNESNINTSSERTEMQYIQNLEVYREGGFTSQKGNIQINTGVTDTTAVTAIGEYKIGALTYAVYTKASGNLYAMDAGGGPETSLASGLSGSAVTQFVNFNSKIVGFNGVNNPWSWNGMTYSALTGTPAAWGSSKPYSAAVFGGRRIFAVAGSTIYYCALGNENDWTTGSDAGQLSNLFNDNTNITGICEYGSALAVHSSFPGITMIGGTQPADYAAKRIASNRAMVGKLAYATINDNQFFFTGDAIVPLITTDLGVIKLGKEIEISSKIKPFLNGTEDELPLLPIDKTKNSESILIPNYTKNEMLAYFKSPGSSLFDIAAIFNFDNMSWVFRKTTPVSAAAKVGDNILTGTSDGKILQEFVGTSLVSGTFLKTLLSGFYDFGAQHLRKRIVRVYLWFKSSTDLNLQFKLKGDYNSVDVFTKTISSSGVSTAAAYNSGAYGEDSYASSSVAFIDFPVNVNPARSFQFELSSADSTVDFKLLQYGFEVEYDDPY